MGRSGMNFDALTPISDVVRAQAGIHLFTGRRAGGMEVDFAGMTP